MNNPTCVSLALYDWLDDLDMLALHDVVREYFDGCVAIPDAVYFVDLENRELNVKWSDVSTWLSEHGSMIRACGYYHTFPSYAQLVFGWDVCVGISTVLGRALVFSCDVARCAAGLDNMESVATKVFSVVAFRYGIGYERRLMNGPEMYADGMAAGLGYSDAEEQERNEITNWFYERRGPNRHLQGLLRDVYPLNILTEVHVNHLVGDATLQEWIAASDGRGTLRRANENLWFWRLEEEQIPPVRRELSNAGMLIASLGPFS